MPLDCVSFVREPYSGMLLGKSYSTDYCNTRAHPVNFDKFILHLPTD